MAKNVSESKVASLFGHSCIEDGREPHNLLVRKKTGEIFWIIKLSCKSEKVTYL